MTIDLDPTDILRITTSSTSPVAVTAVWSDDEWATSNRTETAIVTATTTTIVAAPSSGVREVRAVSIYNARTGAEQSVEPQRYNGTAYPLAGATLQAGERIGYESKTGWQVFNVASAVKAVGMRGAQGVAGEDGAAGAAGAPGPAITLPEAGLVGRDSAGAAVAKTAAESRAIINVDDGATKGTITKRLVRAGGSALVAGTAVSTYSTRVHRADTAAKIAAAGGFTGLSIAAASADETGQFVTAGPVDPAVFSLGAGVACAVGVDASGLAVRATDPTCISWPFVLGRCDTDGVVTVEPRRMFDIDLADLGAVDDYVSSGNRGTSIGPLLQLAIRLLDPLRGGTIRIPFGRYRLGQKIYIDRRVRIIGAGGDRNYGASVLFCDEGVTGFHILSNSQYAPGQGVGVNYAGGQHCEIEHFKIVASGRAATSYVGTYNQATSQITNLTTPNDFTDGQIVKIPGGGVSTILQDGRITATTVNGSPNVTITGPGQGNYQGLHNGAWLRMGAAFATKASVITLPNPASMPGLSTFQITMSANAAATGTYSIEYILDAFACIRSGGGTSTLAVDFGHGENSAAGVAITHADCGFYVQNKAYIHHCSVGTADNALDGHEFAGPGILISASTGWLPSPGYNANCWSLADINMYGNKGGGVVVQGNDANAGLATNVDCTGAATEPRWCFQDGSGLGNTWVGCHATGGYGFLSVGAMTTNFTIFMGCYAEGGTTSSFGSGTKADGNLGIYDQGGFSCIGGVTNKQVLGRTDQSGGNFSTMEQLFDRTQGIRFRGNTAESGSTFTDFRPLKSGDGAPGSFKAFGWFPSNNNGSPGLMLTDTNNTVMTAMVTPAWNSGLPVMFRGVWIGGGQLRGGTVSALTDDTRYVGFFTNPVTASDWRTWRNGDIALNSRASGGNDWIFGWINTTTSTTAAWVAMARVIRQTAPTQTYTAVDAGTIASGDATTDGVIANMRTRIAELVLAVAELRTKLAAANVTA